MSDTTITDVVSAGASDATPPSKPRKRSGSLNGMVLAELQQVASGLGLRGTAKMKKATLVEAITSAQGATSAAPVKRPAAVSAAPQAAAPVAVTASNAANAAERAPHVPRPAGEPAPRKVHRPDAAPLRRLKQMAQPTPDVLQVMLDGRRQNAIPRHTAKPGLVLDRG